MPLDQRGFEIPAETKPEVFSLEGLRDWLMKQPPKKRYDYSAHACNGGCLIDRYVHAHGFPMHHPSDPRDVNRPYGRMAVVMGNGKWDDCIAYEEPWTFDAALKRCNAAIAARKGA